jgi:hypothetical protein
MHGGPEMRKSGRDPSEETSPSLDLRMSHGYKNRIREQLQKSLRVFQETYVLLLHQVLNSPSPEKASGTEAATRGCPFRPFCVEIFPAN